MSTPGTSASASLARVKSYSLAASLLFGFLLCISYATNAADRQIFPMLLTFISKEFGYTLREAGLLATFFTLGQCLSGIPTGYVLDRWSRKSVIIIGMVIYSVFTLTTIWAKGFWDMLAYRALTGLGEGMQLAALFAVMGSYFYKKRALAVGCIQSCYGVGAFLAPYLGTKLFLATQSWRAPFIVFTFAGLTMAAIIRVVIPSAVSESKGPETVSGPVATVHANVPDYLWNRNVILAAIGSAALGVSLFGFISLYSTFVIKVLHFAPMSAALALSCYGLGGLTSWFGGWLGVRFNQRGVAAVAFICLAINAYLMYNVVTTVKLQCLLAFLVGVFGTGFLASGLPPLLQRSVRPQMVGRASGIFVTFVYGTGIFSGWVLAWLVEKIGWGGAGFVELSLVPLVGLTTMILVREDQLMARTTN
jgi:MFS family permease